jgi:tungstate transport system permease protein
LGGFAETVLQAGRMVVSFDPELYGIIGLSLLVSLIAVSLAGVLGIAAGVAIGLKAFRGKGLLVSILNTMMGVPPVVVGLITFIILSRQGPLGSAQLLFTPAAMVIAQTVLVFPIIAALAHATVTGQDPLLRDAARTLGASRAQVALLVIFEARYGLMAALTAGFGRAIAEVGAVLMVGGNIKGATRTMTTAIAMQTSMGDYQLALALGLVLILLAFAVNAVFYRIQRGGA